MLSHLVEILGVLVFGTAPTGIGKTVKQKKKERVLVMAILGVIAVPLAAILIYTLL